MNPLRIPSRAVGFLRRGTRWTTAKALNAAPAGMLAGLARALGRTRPFGLYPGWKFAVEEDRPTWDVTWRLRLWEAYRRRGIERPVRVRWYDDLVVDLALGNDQSRCLYVSGSFEPNEFWFLGWVLTPGAAFVDIGANEGFYTVFAARRVGSEGRVYAFEPSPRERARLEGNLRANRLDNVTVFTQGLAEQAGRAVLHVADPEHNGQNSLGAFGHSGVECAENLEIELTTLDHLRERGSIGKIDVIKMDVEGAEMRVLRGATNTLRRDKPILLLELFDAALRGQGSSAEQVLTFLKGAGFDLYQFDAASGKPIALRAAAAQSSNIIACHPRGKGLQGVVA
jgi:FkbM family methyltransferase